MRRSCPVASRAAAPIRPRKWPSIHSRVKSFGTEIANVSSVNSTPAASANHVRYVVSLSAPLSRPATSDHRLCAVSSTWRLTRRDPLLRSPPGRREHTNVRAAGQRPGAVDKQPKKRALCRLFAEPPDRSTGVEKSFRSWHDSRFSRRSSILRAVDNGSQRPSSILAARAWLRPPRVAPHLEAGLSAQRASPEAPARVSCPNGDQRGACDPQAASCEGAQAPLRLTSASGPRKDVERRHRLSRSRDFDAVYRHGRSVSTRFLVLYSFARDDDGPPRIGFAVPRGTGGAVVRNRVKRQLRETWGARLPQIPVGRDYVLIARPGLPDAVEARGFDWLGERVDEVLGKAGS